MEFKLLNFNRFMANFSTKLVGGFIPVIVYKYTGSIVLALSTIIIQYFVNFLLNISLRNVLVKHPQMFLLLRIVPICIYEVLLLFIELNPLLCVIGIGLAFSVSYTFKLIPNEVLFAYVNANSKTGTGRRLAISKVIEQSAIIFGYILGGLSLDFLDMKVLIIVSLALYLIGAVPLFIYHLTHKKDNDNQEYSSYAHIVLKEHSFNTVYANSVSKKIRVIYALFYFLQESLYAMTTLLPLLLFTITGKFTYSAMAGAIFDGVFGIGCYIAGKFERKKDFTKLSQICGILVGIIGMSLIFLNEDTIWLLYLLIGIMAFCFSITYFFMYRRMLIKSKLVGRNTTCVINKINMNCLSICFVVAFGLFSPIAVCFLVGGSLSIASGIVSPIVEEKTRQILVDHLEDNEIREK